jgi:hypothetical protein
MHFKLQSINTAPKTSALKVYHSQIQIAFSSRDVDGNVGIGPICASQKELDDLVDLLIDELKKLRVPKSK